MADQKLTAKLGLDTNDFDSTLGGLSNKLKNISVGWGAAVAAGGGIITKVLQGVSEAFLDTTMGVKAATAAQELWAQSTYNLATGMVNFNKTMYDSLKIAEYMVWLRQDNRKDLIEEAKLQKEYNRLYFEIVDRGKTDAERIKLMNDAIKINNDLYDTRIKNVKEELKLVQAQLAVRPKSNKLLDEEAKLQAQLITLDGERYTGMRRLQSQKTSLEEQTKNDNLKKYLDWIDEQNRKTDQLAEATKEAARELENLKRANEAFYLKGFRGESLYGAVSQKNVIGGGLAAGGSDLAGTNNKGAIGAVNDMTQALQLQSEAINILSYGFESLFSSAEDGFENMINTIISGIERLVAEYLAKAVILGFIRALFPGSDLAIGATQGLWNMGIGGRSSVNNIVGHQSAPLNINVQGFIKGKDIALAMRRNV